MAGTGLGWNGREALMSGRRTVMMPRPVIGWMSAAFKSPLVKVNLR